MIFNLLKSFHYQFLIIGVLFLFGACGKDDHTDPLPPSKPDTTLNKKEVGVSAQDFLNAKNYDKVTVEILSVDDHALPQAVLNDFVVFLKDLVHKPGGVEIKTHAIPSPDITSYTLENLIEIEDEQRNYYNDKNKLALYIFIADAKFKSEDVLGVAYRNTSFTIFSEKIKEHTGSIGQPDEEVVLQTVLRHELGHLLGLVNVGTPMVNNHQDSEHGHHCNDNDCLMYYAVDTGDFLDNLIGNNSPPQLDENCKADLKNNGGK